MADWIEDEWDSSSPIGYDSSSLHQSIREVLDSALAECSAGAFGAFCSSNVDKPSALMEIDVPNEAQVASHDEKKMEIEDETNEMVLESHVQRQVNFDKNQEFSQTGSHLDGSQDSTMKEIKRIPVDLTESSQSNFETHKVCDMSPQVNVVEDERKNREGVPEAEDTQSGVGMEYEHKPTSEHITDGQNTGIQKPQEDSLRSKKEKLNVDRILADYQKTKVAHWIKIDWRTKKSCPKEGGPMTEYHQRKMNESELIPTVKSRLKTHNMEGHNGRGEHDDHKITAATEHDAMTRKDIHNAGSVMNVVHINSNMETTSGNLLHAINQTSETSQMIQSIADDLKSPGLEEESTKRQEMENISLTGNRLEIGVEKEWAEKNSKMAGEKIKKHDQSQECIPVQKPVAVVQTEEMSDLSGDEAHTQRRAHVSPGYIDFTDDSQSSEYQSSKEGVHQKDEQGEFTEIEGKNSNGMNEILEDEQMVDDELDAVESNVIPSDEYQKPWSTDDSETSMESQASKGSHTYGLPEASTGNKQLSDFKSGAFHYNRYYECDKTLERIDTLRKNYTLDEHKLDEMDLNRGGHEMQIKEILGREEPTQGETLHKELKHKYMNMNFSKEMTPTKEDYQEHQPVCEEIEEFAMACDDSPMEDVKNIKIEPLIDDNQQTNTGEINKDEFDVEAKNKPVTIWRQELLSSDFSLIYGSLRAVLMRNISNEDRHRLIQTMIATMSEIEQVTMGEGNPTQQSVRCETPELTPDFVEGGENEKQLDSDENGEIKKEPAHPRPQVVGEQLVRQELAAKERLSLREREMMMNLQRIEKLMKKCSDGTMVCLICKKRGIPTGRVCRACSAMAYRIERNYTIGLPLPTCDHANYWGGAKCKSCRFRKYSFLSMTATDTRVREVNAKECPICKKTSYYSRGWKCTKCYYFFLKLTRRKGPMPACIHSGEFPDQCEGCRCYNLQEAWADHEDRVYPLPLVKKNGLSTV